jgi:hypothetical protein
LQPFVSRDAYLLWKFMTKGERLVQRYYGKVLWEVGFGHGHGQRGSNIEEGSKFMDKRSTQVGGASS